MKAFVWTVVLLCVAVGVGPARGQEPGQTPRPTTVEPVREPTDEELVKLDKTLPEWASVKDDAPFIMPGRVQMDAIRMRRSLEEEKAYSYVLGVAHRQPGERLRKCSLKDVPPENLFHDIRQDYLRELIHVEGTLAMVRPMKPTDDLRDLNGIESLYETWVFVQIGDKSKLFCLVVSELPEGVKLGEDQNLRVTFDAYYFKLWHYETRKVKDPAKDPDKHDWQRAPLFLGKTFEVRGPVTAETTYTPGMLYGLVGGLAALALAGVTLGLWFRRGDRHIKAAAQQKIVSGVTFENSLDPEQGPANRIADQF
jgi:hypothetical protein